MPQKKQPMQADPFKEGVQAYKEGKLDKARKFFEQAQAQNPNHVDAINNLGILLAQQGKLKEAEKILKKGLAQNPRHVPLYDNLSRILVMQERFGEAMKLLEEGKMLTQDPQFDYKILMLQRIVFGDSLG